MILLQQALFSIAEPALNKALKHDHTAAAKLHQLEGKSLSVELTDIKLSVNLSVFNGAMRLSSDISQRDCYINTELVHIKKLADASQITALIKSDVLTLEGELTVAQRFSSLFMDNQIDWQEWCSRYLGDALTYKLFNAGKQINQKIKNKTIDLDYTVQSALVDEIRLVPSAIELDSFSKHVDSISAKTEKLTAEIKLLKDSL